MGMIAYWTRSKFSEFKVYLTLKKKKGRIYFPVDLTREAGYNGRDRGGCGMELRKLNQRHRMMLRMVAAGIPLPQIESELAVSAQAIRNTIGCQLGQQYLASLETELDDEFKRLFKKVVKVIDDGLSCADSSIALASANLWLKAHGKFVHKVETRNLTAEDIIAKIVSGELVLPGKAPKLVGEGLGRAYEEAEFEVGPSLQ